MSPPSRTFFLASHWLPYHLISSRPLIAMHWSTLFPYFGGAQVVNGTDKGVNGTDGANNFFLLFQQNFGAPKIIFGKKIFWQKTINFQELFIFSLPKNIFDNIFFCNKKNCQTFLLLKIFLCQTFFFANLFFLQNFFQLKKKTGTIQS